MHTSKTANLWETGRSFSQRICVSRVLNVASFEIEFSRWIATIGEGAGGSETASSIPRDIGDLKNR